ncbi:helix-turn-helix domain-containing protein [uncultured Nocardioides sp.]|uniref:helix-turn-helix domain-containing protein n=1 Tax=uncultured Nocardioides sp. TaxID=198441 RepID=UPI0026314815|nr:helix-turn-helix domain-containing protein [uncultured Nocardioides sp.]
MTIPVLPPAISPSANDGLITSWKAERPLLLVGRYSSSSSRLGCRKAVLDLQGAARDLNSRYGLDVRPCLPDPERMVELLFTSPYRVWSTTSEGDRFLNQFLVLDFRPEIPLVVSLSAGSARKVDEGFDQPHAVHLRNGLTSGVPFAGFFAKRFDRLVRSMWETGKLLNSLRTLNARYGSYWAADGDGGEWSIDKTVDLLYAMRGNAALVEAENIQRKRSDRLVELTGDVMEGGRVRYPLASGLPPGLMRYRMRNEGISYLSLDSPAFYPAVNDASDLPNVRDDQGDLVDQVATVQWLLSQWGRPGWTHTRLARELISRRYSTEALRQHRHNPGAFYGSPDGSFSDLMSGPANKGDHDARSAQLANRHEALAMLSTFADNLELYETGVLRRTVGGKAIAIANVFPPGGAWATAEDFQRIHNFENARRERANRRSRWSFSGLAVELDGVPHSLAARVAPRVRREPRGAHAFPVRSSAATAGATSDGQSETGIRAGSGHAPEVNWGFNSIDVDTDVAASVDADLDAQSGSRRGTGNYTRLRADGVVWRQVPPIPDRLLVASMIRALVDSDGQPLRAFVESTRSDGDGDGVSPDEASLQTMRAELADLERVQAQQGDLLIARDVNDQPVLAAALHAHATAQFESRALRIQHLSLDVQRRADMVALSQTAAAPGVSAAQLTAMVNGLRDPRASEVRDLVHASIRNLRVTTRVEVGDRGLKGMAVRFDGDLVVRYDDESWSVPFGDDYRVGAVFEREARALLALARLRRGEPRRGVQRGRLMAATQAAADLFDLAPAQFAISNCDDGPLLKVGMAALFPRPGRGEPDGDVPHLDDLAEDPDLVADFGDVRALAESIRRGYDGVSEQRWLLQGAGRSEVAAILDCWRDPSPQRSGNKYENFGRIVRGRCLEDRWELRRGHRPTLSPCPHCGSRLAARMRIREVDGYLCLECRRDRGGVQWPSRFDRYVSHPSLYTAAGVTLDVPDGFTGAAREMVSDLTSPIVPRRYRVVSTPGSPPKTRPGEAWGHGSGGGGAPSADFEASVVAAYASGEEPVMEIARRHGISVGTVYTICRRAGVGPRRRSSGPGAADQE